MAFPASTLYLSSSNSAHNPLIFGRWWARRPEDLSLPVFTDDTKPRWLVPSWASSPSMVSPVRENFCRESGFSGQGIGSAPRSFAPSSMLASVVPTRRIFLKPRRAVTRRRVELGKNPPPGVEGALPLDLVGL